MLSMINLEMEQIEDIQKELNQGAIDLNDIENRFVSILIGVPYYDKFF